MQKITAVLIAVTIAALVGMSAFAEGRSAGYYSAKGVYDVDPLCSFISYVEPDAKCTVLGRAEGKIAMPDKTELYCKLKPKAGLVCNPTEPQRAPAPQPQPEPPAKGSAASTKGK